MSMELIETITNGISIAGLILFVGLAAVSVVAMFRRIVWFIHDQTDIPVILKRDFVLFIAFVVIFGEIAVLRAFGVILGQGTVERLALIVQQNVVGLAALTYWVKVELFDIEDPEEK